MYLTRVAVDEVFEEVSNHFANATQVNLRILGELADYTYRRTCTYTMKDTHNWQGAHVHTTSNRQILQQRNYTYSTPKQSRSPFNPLSTLSEVFWDLCIDSIFLYYCKNEYVWRSPTQQCQMGRSTVHQTLARGEVCMYETTRTILGLATTLVVELQRWSMLHSSPVSWRMKRQHGCSQEGYTCTGTCYS